MQLQLQAMYTFLVVYKQIVVNICYISRVMGVGKDSNS